MNNKYYSISDDDYCNLIYSLNILILDYKETVSDLNSTINFQQDKSDVSDLIKSKEFWINQIERFNSVRNNLINQYNNQK